MITIALFEPEIPQNTGTIGRLCVGTGARLVLAGKLGFSLDDKHMKRAGLDYWKNVELDVLDTVNEFFLKYPPTKYEYAFFTKFVDTPYTEVPHSDMDNLVLIFGKETMGLPDWVREKYPDKCYKIPQTEMVRSLNVANAASIVIYDVLRRNGFKGLK